MEQVTSRVDSELVRSHERFLGFLPDNDDDNDDITAGNCFQNQSGRLVVNLSDHMCKCNYHTIKSEATRNMNKMCREFWVCNAVPNHHHTGEHHGCDICLAVKGCSNIKDLVAEGDMRRSYILGGAPGNRKRKVDDCADEAISNINQEANKILSYIYNRFPEVETSSSITEAMISNAMQSMKLNIIHTDLPRVFEIVIAKHKKGLTKKGDIQHPLHYVVCHMKDLINPLIAFEKSIEGYSYSELLLNLKMQSSTYENTSLEKLPLKIDISTMIHPIFIAFFWKKLPCVEQMSVESDQFQLLKNIHLTVDKIKPSSFNFDLTTSRWNEKNPIAFFGVTNIIDTEIKRVLCHVYLKKIIYKLRSGELHSMDSNKLISWIKKIFVFNSYDTGDEAEQMITAFLNLFLIRPVKLFVQDQVMLGQNCNYIINTNMDDYMKECPFIYCETVSQIGSMPFPMMPSELSCLRYDRIKNRAVLNLSMVDSKRPINTNPCQPAISCNGILPIFTKRKSTLSYRDMASAHFEDEIEYISVAPLTIQKEYIIDGKQYTLESVLCYETISSLSISSSPDKEISAGYFALVKTDSNKWFKYSITTFVGPENINSLKDSYVSWYKAKTTPDKKDKMTADPDGAPPFEYINKSDETITERFYDRFANNIVDAQVLILDGEEAMDLAETKCCLLIYAEDYDMYKTMLVRSKYVM